MSDITLSEPRELFSFSIHLAEPKEIQFGFLHMIDVEVMTDRELESGVSLCIRLHGEPKTSTGLRDESSGSGLLLLSRREDDLELLIDVLGTHHQTDDAAAYMRVLEVARRELRAIHARESAEIRELVKSV